MDEEILRGQPDAPRLPLVLQSRHVEQTWWYMAPQRSDETEQMALRRVFWSMVHDVIPSLGDVRNVSLYGVGDTIGLKDLHGSHGERLQAMEAAMPVADIEEINLDLSVHLRTPSGHYETSAAVVNVDLESSSEGVEIGVHIDSTVYRQADENASEEVKAQASFNEKKLPSFLRSLQFAFDAEFSGRDSDMLGPDGYLPPGANQAGLPRLSSTAPGWKTR